MVTTKQKPMIGKQKLKRKGPKYVITVNHLTTHRILREGDKTLTKLENDPQSGCSKALPSDS